MMSWVSRAQSRGSVKTKMEEMVKWVGDVEEGL